MVYGRKLIDSVPLPLIFNQHNAQNPQGKRILKLGAQGNPSPSATATNSPLNCVKIGQVKAD